MIDAPKLDRNALQDIADGLDCASLQEFQRFVRFQHLLKIASRVKKTQPSFNEMRCQQTLKLGLLVRRREPCLPHVYQCRRFCVDRRSFSIPFFRLRFAPRPALTRTVITYLDFGTREVALVDCRQEMTCHTVGF